MKLNSKITIQRKVDAQNTFEDTIWEDYKDVWGNIKNINGKEYYQAMQTIPNANKKVIIRYKEEFDQSINPQVTKDYRVKYKDNFYNIRYADNIKEENRYIEFLLESE